MLDRSNKSTIVLQTVLALLNARLAETEVKGSIDQSTPLLEVGLIDSTRLLDIIMEVEQRCAVEFDPTRVEIDGALTIGNLVSAFTNSVTAISI